MKAFGLKGMKHAVVVATVLAVAGFANAQSEKHEEQNMGAPNNPAVTNQATAGAMTDAQIAHVLKTANDGEIDAGKLAAKKADNKEVKDFAKMMVDEHKENNKQSKDVFKKDKIKAKDNDLSKTLKKDAKEKIAAMKKLKGNEFDRAYMASQIAMHEAVLDNLNNKLIPSAQHPELKAHLEMTKTHVQNHLAKAKDIEIAISK